MPTVGITIMYNEKPHSTTGTPTNAECKGSGHDLSINSSNILWSSVWLSVRVPCLGLCMNVTTAVLFPADLAEVWSLPLGESEDFKVVDPSLNLLNSRMVTIKANLERKKRINDYRREPRGTWEDLCTRWIFQKGDQ